LMAFFFNMNNFSINKDTFLYLIFLLQIKRER